MSRRRVHVPLVSAEESAVLLGRDSEDVSAARREAERSGSEAVRRRLTVSVPLWMAECLDKEARRRGITTEALIRDWLAGQIERHAAEAEK